MAKTRRRGGFRLFGVAPGKAALIALGGYVIIKAFGSKLWNVDKKLDDIAANVKQTTEGGGQA